MEDMKVWMYLEDFVMDVLLMQWLEVSEVCTEVNMKWGVPDITPYLEYCILKAWNIRELNTIVWILQGVPRWNW